MTDLNPQANQMGDPSMLRTLDAQARAIWPQESELIRRYGLSDDIRILDAGCGSGEITARLAEMFPKADILGVDILDVNLEAARHNHGHLAPRVRFENQSVYELPAADGTYDFTVNRHVLHSIPHPERVIRELARVTKKGSRLHLLPEDYGMLHFRRGKLDPGIFWHHGAREFGEKTETDLFIGRHAPAILMEMGFRDVSVDYVIVDTLRVPRETMANIFEAWRDGYVDVVAELSRFSKDETRAYFEAIIENVRDPKGYAAWMVPIVSGRVP